MYLVLLCFPTHNTCIRYYIHICMYVCIHTSTYRYTYMTSYNVILRKRNHHEDLKWHFQSHLIQKPDSEIFPVSVLTGLFSLYTVGALHRGVNKLFTAWGENRIYERALELNLTAGALPLPL